MFCVLQPLSVPEKLCHDISIDFMVGLPECEGYDEIWVVVNVTNSSNLLVQFQIRVGTRTKPCQWILPHENPDRCSWAGLTTKNPAFHPDNFASK